MNAPGAPIHYRDLPATTQGSLVTYRVTSDLEGSGLEQCVLVLKSGSASRTVAEGRDEVLYVIGGSGQVEADDQVHQVGADVAIRISGGYPYTLRCTDGPLEVVAVSGAAPVPGATTRSALVKPLDQKAKPAVSDREYRVLFDAESGCSGLTHFIGYVPAVRTPMHIHPYSEMVCIIEGAGTVDINGKVASVSPGWCYYLPEGVPHRVENKDPDNYLVEMCVFTPSGSPEQNTPVE
ncbi:MAG: cupin domain-containing protein [Microbacteriaceae bacterium]